MSQVGDASESLELWKKSAQAWIDSQSETGDKSRQEILDPALETILGDLSGKMILDVGCGEGRYSRLMAAKGAKVTAFDPVPEFIEAARARDSVSTYFVAGAEEIELPAETFDICLSYLTLIDIPDDVTAAEKMVNATKSGGKIVIAMVSNFASTSEGWHKDESGNKLYRTVDGYMEHRTLHLQWRGIEIKNFHRPLSHTLGLFLSRGCVLTGFLEPLPAEESPMFSDEFRAPTFQVYRFKKLEVNNTSV